MGIGSSLEGVWEEFRMEFGRGWDGVWKGFGTMFGRDLEWGLGGEWKGFGWISEWSLEEVWEGGLEEDNSGLAFMHFDEFDFLQPNSSRVCPGIQFEATHPKKCGPSSATTLKHQLAGCDFCPGLKFRNLEFTSPMRKCVTPPIGLFKFKQL